MEVKCPKCRYRFDASVASGIKELATVCPRCGTPFTYTVPTDAPHVEKRVENQPQRAGADEAAIQNNRPVHRTTQPVPPASHYSDSDTNRWKQSKHVTPPNLLRTSEKTQNYMKGCVIGIVVSIVLAIFFLQTCGSERRYTSDDIKTPDEVIKAPTSNALPEPEVINEADEFQEVAPEKAPDWIEGSWVVDSEEGMIRITIHGNHIAEASGGETSHGTFYYEKGCLFCDFGKGEVEVRKLDLENERIDAGDGMWMEKREFY